jgi:hypothetical protein
LVNLRLVAARNRRNRTDDLRADAWLLGNDSAHGDADPQARIYSLQPPIPEPTKTIAGSGGRKDGVARCARNIR